LLEAANSAARRSDFREALARLDEHAVLFPQGALVEEAAVLRISALLGAGERAAARGEANVFLSRFGKSLLADRVRLMITEPPSPTKGAAP
jgi:hypothetical protein